MVPYKLIIWNKSQCSCAQWTRILGYTPCAIVQDFMNSLNYHQSWVMHIVIYSTAVKTWNVCMWFVEMRTINTVIVWLMMFLKEFIWVVTVFMKINMWCTNAKLLTLGSTARIKIPSLPMIFGWCFLMIGSSNTVY